MAACGTEAAANHAECPICFEDLCSSNVGMFVDKDNKRTCRHFFHYDCVKEVMDFTSGKNRDLSCPMCRKEFTNVVRMADPFTDAESWFKLVDADQSGHLTMDEVMDVVLATCNVSEDDVEKVIGDKWKDWDRDSSKGVEWYEFPELLVFIRDNVPLKAKLEVPVITAADGKDSWFGFWDEDGSGELDKDEVARALIKTFEMDGYKTVAEMQKIIECVWPLFDPDSSNTIAKSEFLITHGLADTIVACLQHTGYKRRLSIASENPEA